MFSCNSRNCFLYILESSEACLLLFCKGCHVPPLLLTFCHDWHFSFWLLGSVWCVILFFSSSLRIPQVVGGTTASLCLWSTCADAGGLSVSYPGPLEEASLPSSLSLPQDSGQGAPASPLRLPPGLPGPQGVSTCLLTAAIDLSTWDS